MSLYSVGSKTGAQGPPGPAGPPGASAASYDFQQTTPATEWIVNHNLGHKPLVQVFSTGGVEVEAEVVHISNNQTRIYFVIGFQGTARLT